MAFPYVPFQPTITEPGLKCFGLSALEVAPHRLLADKVHSYIQIRATGPTPYPILPDGTHAIFIAPECGLLSGIRTHAFEMPLLESGDYFGIRFYPAALRYFFNLNMSEVTDELVDHQFFPDSSFRDLSSKIFDASDFLTRAKLCEAWLFKHYMPLAKTSFDHALQMICQFNGNMSVETLSSHVGISSRQLNRYFKQHCGLSTKQFSNIIRFHTAYKTDYLCNASSSVEPPEFTYYDQSHYLKSLNRYLPKPQRVLFDQIKSGFYNTAGA